MNKNKPPIFFVIFNGRINDGCDYPVQTMKQLLSYGQVYGLCLGEPITWKNIWYTSPFVFYHNKSTRLPIVRPLFIIPGQRNRFIKSFNYLLNLFLIRLFLTIRHPNNQIIIWMFEPFYANMICSVFSSSVTVYDCVDYFYDFSYSVREQEQILLRKASYVFANSHELLLHLKRFRKNLHKVPPGFALDLFSSIHNTSAQNHKRHVIGYVGGLDDRIDYKLLVEIAKQQPEEEFHFYGRSYVHEQIATYRLERKFFSLPNVFRHNQVSKDQMPQIINTFDICLIPYKTDSSFNRYCFPMKTMEYFYMKKPVISTEIKELHRYPQLIKIIRSSSEGVQIIQELIHNKWKKGVEERRVAVKNSWDKKVALMCDVMGMNTR